MRETQTAEKPCAAKRGFAALSASVLAVGLTMSQAPAAHAIEETDDSAALSTAVDADLLGLDLADVGYISSGYPSDPGANYGPINLELLNAIELDLGGLNLPLLGEDGLLPADELGALYGYAESPNEYSSTAATGAVNSEGAIDLASGEGYGDAQIDLHRALAEGLGLDLTGVVDDIYLELGALASRAHQDPGGEIETDYGIAGADLYIDSPLVGGLTDTLDTTVTDLDTTLSGVLGPEGAVNETLGGLADGIGSIGGIDLPILGELLAINVDDPTVAVDLDLAGVTDGLLNEPLVSESGVTTLDLSTGQIHVDLEALSGGNLNDRPANTQILSSSELELITGEVTALLEEAVATVTSAVEAAVLGTEVTLDLGLGISAASTVSGNVSAEANMTLGQLLGIDETPLTEDDITLAGTDVSVGGIDIPLGDLLDGIAGPILTEVIPTLTGSVLNDVVLEEGGITGPLDTVLTETLGALDPVFEALPGVVDLTVNAQRESTAIGEGTYTVSALEATVLPGLGEGAVVLPLATSNIRASELDPAIEATPAEVAVGDEVTTDGTGWPSTSTVLIEYIDADGNTVGTSEGVEVDENGEFTDTWTVPEGTALGDLTVRATDEANPEIVVEDTVTVVESDEDGTEDGTEEGDVDGTEDGTVDGDVDGVEDGAETGDVDGAEAGTEDGDVDGAETGTEDGTADGDVDGVEDGTETGDVDGAETGTEDGDVDGAEAGTEDGDVDGAEAGTEDGTADGDVDGVEDGAETGDVDGAETGTEDGDVDGTEAGTEDGDVDGTETGTEDGTADGDVDGVEDGAETGDVDGAETGTEDGDVDGAETGTEAGTEDGDVDGTDDGTADGDVDGVEDGTDDGAEAGSEDGDDGTTDTSVTVTPDAAAPGDSVTIDGEGFESGSSVTVEITDADGNVIGTIEDVEVGEDGSFTTDWTVPEGTEPGELTVTATDESGNTGSDNLTIIEADGTDEDGTEAGTEAGTEDGTADGADAGAEDGTADGAEAGAEDGTADGADAGTEGGTADGADAGTEDGTADGDVDGVEDGTETGAEDGAQDGAADGSEDGTEDSSISIDPDTAAPGDSVTIEGEGFEPGTSVTVEITDEDGDIVGTIEDVEVGEDGSFTTDWTVPEGTDPGELTVTATDESGNTGSDSLTITDADGSEDGTGDSSISITPDTAAPGDDVTIEGEGFEPGSSVTIEITDSDGNTIDTIEDVEVGEDGSFTADWTVPEGTEAGELTVTATDESGNSASENLTVTDADGAQDGAADGSEDGTEDSSVSITPDTAAPGDSVTIEGEGYEPGSSVTVEITDADGNVIDTIEGVEVGEDGSFSIDWTVPEGTEAGELTVTATDESGNTASATLTITDGAGGTEAGVAGTEDGAGDGDQPGDGLAVTGATMTSLAVLALLSLAAGAGILYYNRKRAL